jgi:pilus assembly protein Flp/PilA
MNTLKQLIQNFLADEQGATAIEYGLLAALISVVIITAATAVGTNLNAIFTAISAKLLAAKPV